MAETLHPFTTHFCIVSGQPIPNLAAVLDSRLRPRQVVLFTSPEMSQRAERLCAVLEGHGVQPTLWPLIDRLNLARVREDVQRCLAEVGAEGAVLNATGGQKPMSIAAYEVFRRRGLPALYVETDNTLTWLHPHERAGFELESHLSIRDYLRAYGYQEVSRETGSAYRDEALTAELTELAASQDPALRTLNWAAAQARNTGGPVTLNSGQIRDRRVLTLLRRLDQAGVLAFDARSGSVRFPDEQRRSFANGGWLEQHVAATLSLNAAAWGIDEVAANLQVRADSGSPPVQNELDVAFLARNHLCIVECKTARPRGDDDDADELTQMLYKLDSIRKVGGLVARPMLVSWFTAGPRHRERAALSDIRLVSGEELTRLRMRLQAWVAARPDAR